MNFWEFKEDHSRGYFLPVAGNAARAQGGQLVRSLLLLVASLFKLAAAILISVATLLWMTCRWLWKLGKG